MSQQKGKVSRKQQDSKTKEPTRSRTLLWLLVVVVVTFVTLSPVLKNSFVNQDDNIYIFENTHLAAPITEAAAYYFQPHYFSGNYIPVTMIAYTIAYHLGGGEPEVYHFLSLLLHLIDVLLVFWFIYLLSDRKTFVAAFVALFFGIHPMHVESVAWAAELKDVLYTGFFIAGLAVYYMYLKAPAARRWLPLIGVFVLFVLSALSKPSAIVFPLVLVLLDSYAGRRPDVRSVVEKLPFLLVSIVLGLVAIRAQQADQLINNTYPFWQRALFACYAVPEYLVKFLAPVHLSNFYPFPHAVNGQLPLIYYVAVVVPVLLVVFVLKMWRRSKPLTFGLMFFLVNIVLVLQLVSVGNAIIAERYTYVAYIGLLFPVGLGLYQVLFSADGATAGRYKGYVVAGLVVAISGCSVLSYARCQVWEDQYVLADDMLAGNPDDPIALNNKGYLLAYNKNFAAAAPLLQRAIAMRPGDLKAYANLINAYMALRKPDSAMMVNNAALAVAPHDHDMLDTKGYFLMSTHRYDSAVNVYKRSLLYNPADTTAFIYLSQCYFEMKDTVNSLKTISDGLDHAPGNYLMLNTKGYILLTMRRYSEAVGCLKAALKASPDLTTAAVNLENCYRAMGDTSHAANNH
jgi:protein O-mannosyl-transferase